MSKNILFVGGGRRVELAKLFKDIGYTIYGYELDYNCPLASVAEIIIGLPFSNDYFKTHIQEICQKHKIKFVVPLIDEASYLLGDFPLCIGNDVTGSFYDKLTLTKTETYGFYPCPLVGTKTILKPRFGSNSKGLIIKEVWDGKCPEDMVAQGFIKGQEYTVDAYFNKNYQLVQTCARKRIRVEGGEVVEAESSFNQTYHDWIGSVFNGSMRGPVCFQFINEKIIEINGRFGGGSTLSCNAGMPMYVWLDLEYTQNKPIEKQLSTHIKNKRMIRAYKDYYFEAKNNSS